MNLSSVTICRNEASIIKQLLDCLCWVQPNEAIFVDDNSTDDTIKIIESYRDRLNIKIFTRSLDSYGEQRNFAISKATCDYILVLDADETISKNLLALMYSIDTNTLWSGFIAFSFPTADMVDTNRFHNITRLQPHVRLWKRDDKIRYIREVHEYLVYFLEGKFYDLNKSHIGIPSIYIEEIAVLHWYLMKPDEILLEKGKRFLEKFGKASGDMGLPMPNEKHFVTCKYKQLAMQGSLIRESWR